MVQRGEREASQAKKEMVEANLRLVIWNAKPYTHRGLLSHPPWGDGSELYPKLLSVVLMKEMAMDGKKRAIIYGPKTDRILAGVLTVASGGWLILILLGYWESLGWGHVLGLFVLFGIGVASLLAGRGRR